MTVHASRVAAILLAALLVVLPGCYRYAYHRPTPQRPFDAIAIDEQTPQKTIRWSYLWGLLNEPPWSPMRTDPLWPTCDGKGAGKVEVAMVWYSIPMLLVTLGAAVPGQMTIYCTTYRELDPSP